MGVRLEHETIHLEGECPVEDAEPLLALLRAGPARRVALAAAGPLHTAVLQVLLALRPVLQEPGGPDAEGGAPGSGGGDAFFHRWLTPLLVGTRTG